MSDQTPLQDVWLDATCFGCGPGNPEGLHIKSYWSEDGRFVIATHHPHARYNAGFSNVMYGGLVASLIDCHSIWTAIAFAYRAEGRPHGSPPAITYVTGQLTVKYLKPTPLDQPIHLKAWVEGEIGRKMRVLCELGIEGLVTATGDVIAVRIDADKSIGAGN
jgi:hypothetical protein